MSKNYRNTFADFLVLILTIARLGNRIMTLTVKIWNDAFILISIPFSWFLSCVLIIFKVSWPIWKFTDFFLTFKVFTIQWLFPELWGTWINLLSSAAHSRFQIFLLLTRFHFISAWISNHMPSKVWAGITYPFQNFNGCTVAVCEWLSNFIRHFITGVVTNPCWD